MCWNRMRPTVSHLGLYNYDSTIFDDFALPDSVSARKAEFVDEILSELGQLEALYPNAEVFKRILRAWSNTRLPEWRRVETALTAEYNPIHNFDRNEDYTDTNTEKETGTSNSTSSTESTANGTNENTESETAFNTESFKNRTKNAGTDSASSNASATNKSDNTITRETSVKHTAHLYGNIGVTTTQKMMREELDIRRNDLESYIIDDFKHRFCLMVY